MPRGMMEPPTRFELLKFYLRSKLCRDCKYSGYYGLLMCHKHSKKNWARWQATRELKESWEKKRLFFLNHIKNRKGFLRPKHFYMFPFLKFFDRLLIRWYQRKK